MNKNQSSNSQKIFIKIIFIKVEAKIEKVEKLKDEGDAPKIEEELPTILEKVTKLERLNLKTQIALCGK